MNKNKTNDNQNKFSLKMQKKLVILFAMILLAFAGLSVRLFVINKEDGEKYKKQVLSNQRYESTPLPYKRGDIIDAKGTRLAVSEKVYNLIIDSKQIMEKEDYLNPTVQALTACFEINEEQLRADIAAKKDTSRYYKLLKQLTYDQIAPFLEMQNDEEKGKNIMGVWFEEEYKRTYPGGSLASDVIGFTDNDNRGTYGLEEYYNEVLSGSNGREYGYLNDDSILERTTKAAVDGNSIVTSIDANIQTIVEKYINKWNEEHRGKFREGELGSNNTGAIVMDPNTGQILAMASYPGFDLNNPKDLSGYYTEEELAAMDDETRAEKWGELWRNFCIFNTYEPGSTAKTFTMAAGLEYGKLLGTETYTCGGFKQIPGHPKPIKCNNRYGHGTLDVSGALEQSCNVALMDMGLAMGKEVFMDELLTLNMGLKTNIDLAGEGRTEGLLFNVDKMVPTDLAIGSFGQGYNVTMVQMVAAFSSLINGGYYYEPHVVSKIVNSDGSTVENIEPRVLKQTVSATTSDKIIEYCDAVVAEGTGAKARPAGYTMGGKTGTAETLPRGNKQYVVSFLGYAPAKDPQVVIYVVIDRPNEEDQPHASYAVEIVRNIMSEVLPYMNVFMTEELSEEEKAELETLSQNMISKPETEPENPEQNPETVSNNQAEPEKLEPEIKIDPETGYAIDPESGELLDPETGQPMDSGSSNLGGL